MLPGCATALDKKKCVPRLELKLSFQEGIAPGKNLGEQLDFMEDLEVRGFEPNGRNLPARVNEIRNALSEQKTFSFVSGVRISRLGRGLYAAGMCHCIGQEEVRATS